MARLYLQCFPVLLIPVRKDRIRLDLVLVVAVLEEDAPGHRKSGSREPAVPRISAVPADELPIVRQDDVYGHLHLLRGDVRDVFTGVHDVAPFEVTLFERIHHLICFHKDHRSQLCGCIHHGDGVAVWRGGVGLLVRGTRQPGGGTSIGVCDEDS